MSKLFLVLIYLFLIIWSEPVLSQSDEKKNMDTGNKSDSSFNHTYLEVDNKFYSLATDLSALGEGASVLFFNDKCIVIGKHGVPYILNASMEFDPSLLPIALQTSIYNVESIILSLELDGENSKKNALIPEWLDGFKDVKYLTLEHLKFSVSFFENANRIKHLIVVGAEKQDVAMLIEYITELKSLEYLVHSDFLMEGDISKIKAKVPSLIILSEVEYDKKLESGEIRLPE